MIVTASTISCLWLSADTNIFNTNESKHRLTGSRTVNFTDCVRHSSFIPHVGGQMRWLARVILGKGLDFTAMTFGTFARQKPERAVTRSRKFPVGLGKDK